jgi:Tol biopolymer transport system component
MGNLIRFNRILCGLVALMMAPGLLSVGQAQPANTRIAFYSERDGNGEIYVMNVDGTNQTRLTNNSASDANPSWSPDGTKIAFESERDGNFEIYTMNADGTDQTRLTNNSASDTNPSWSPDGTKIAFSSNRDGEWEIFVINVDGTNEIELFDPVGGVEHPAWSPDGTKIVFSSNPGGNYDIYVINVDGSGQTRLTDNSTSDAYPAWSPDGTMIAFHSTRDGNSEVYVMNADGSNPINMTNNSRFDGHPSWSPDGTKVTFRANTDGAGSEEIYSMNADGSDQIALTNNTALDESPAWSPFLSGTFTDVGASAGVTTTAAGTCAAWADYDNDGDLDLLLVNGSDILYRNNGDGTFTDMTATAGVTDSGHGLAGVWADYDNDGDLDLYVANYRGEPNRLYWNNGDGTFTDVADAAGVNLAGDEISAIWGDYDNDGYVDLFIANDRSNIPVENSANVLYHNNGNGTFTEATASAGIDPLVGIISAGAAWGDYDNDGDLDLYVSNQAEAGENNLYRNNGNGTFTDVTSAAGVNGTDDSQGCAWGDYDNDGDLDLLVVTGNRETPPDASNVLYRNNGDGTFTDVTGSAGLTFIGDCVATAWADADNDGDLDVYITTSGNFGAVPDLFYRNNGDGTFTEAAAVAGLSVVQNGIALAWGDYDQDGDLDLFVDGNTNPAHLYRNDGNSNRWLHVKVVGVTSNRAGIGARVRIVAGGVSQIREVSGGAGRATQESLPVEFGLGGTAIVDSLIIRWPSGIVQVLTGVSTNQRLTVTEGETIPEPAQPIILALGMAFGSSGDTLRVPATLTNPNTQPVGGLQFDVHLGDTEAAAFVRVDSASVPAGFAASAYTAGDSTRILLHSNSGQTIAQGENIALMTLLYRLTDAATLGSTIALILVNVEIGDSSGVAFPDSAIHGSLTVGLRGDINLDGRLSILDVIKLVRILIEKDPTPANGSTAFKIADVDANGVLNVADVIALVNRILGLPAKPLAAAPSQPVMVRLDVPMYTTDGRMAVPVVLATDGVVAGLQAAFAFDPTRLEVGAPQLSSAASGLSMDSHVADGKLRLVMYPVQPGQGLSPGQSVALYVPVRVRDGVEGTPSLTLVEMVLAGPRAQIVPVVIETPSVAVTLREAAVPTAFALHAARPNPFNPSTQIAYEVPAQAHITLIVYNLLGQEVARLVDGVKSPGRYEVTWDGRNAQGVGVASGVYVYRMTSSTGYSQTKRMTMLK